METDPTQFAAGLGSSLFGSLTVIRFIIGMVFYFLPTLIARERDFAMKGWLFWTNLFLGWTVLGWGICLLWAACATSFEQDA